MNADSLMAGSLHPQNYNETWEAMFNDVLEAHRLTIVLAPSREVATVFARLRGIHPRRWVYVDGVIKYRMALMGQMENEYPYEVVKIEGWDQGASPLLVAFDDEAVAQLAERVKRRNQRILYRALEKQKALLPIAYLVAS